MPQIATNTLEVNGMILLVQACCPSWANIQIFPKDPELRHQKGGFASNRVAIPSLNCQTRNSGLWDMPFDVYPQHLQASREAILSVVERLNEDESLDPK